MIDLLLAIIITLSNLQIVDTFLCRYLKCDPNFISGYPRGYCELQLEVGTLKKQVRIPSAPSAVEIRILYKYLNIIFIRCTYIPRKILSRYF